METSDVKRRIVETIERAKRHAADRRTRADDADRAFARLLDEDAVPMFRQIVNVLKTQGYPFNLFTPGGSVRLMSDRSADDFIELALDTTGDEPAAILHVKRTRGRRVIETELPIGDPAHLTEDDVLNAVLKELQPFVER